MSSSEDEGVGAGVLIRAIEPLEGLDAMYARRPGVKLHDLARGPGRLTVALGVGLESMVATCAPVVACGSVRSKPNRRLLPW